MKTLSGSKPVRGGMTLIELLVVISIMMLLALVGIPALRPAMESRQIRESTRAINSYIHGAQIRALETGRPAGVMLTRDDILPQAATVLQRVEVPPDYAGDLTGTRARAQEWTESSVGYAGTYHWRDRSIVLKVQIRENELSPGVVRRGDLMQLGGQGPWYTIAVDGRLGSVLPAADQDVYKDFPVDSKGFIDFMPSDRTVLAPSPDNWITNYVLTLVLPSQQLMESPWTDADPGNSPSTAAWDRPVSFRIRRAPSVAILSASAPLQLPGDMVVDLSCSGTELDPQRFNAMFSGTLDTSPILIMFSPTGSVDRLYINGMEEHVITPIYLMIGRRDRLAPPGPEDNLANWQDLKNLWLSINPRTGSVKAAEVFADSTNPLHIDPNTNTLRPAGVDTDGGIEASRTFAQQMQTAMGGR